MGTLLALLVLFAGLVLLPILLLKLVLGLLFLPFQLLGFVFKLVFGVLGGLVRVGFGLAMALVSIFVVLFCVVLLPLLPFLLLGAFVWLVARMARPRPAPTRPNRARCRPPRPKSTARPAASDAVPECAFPVCSAWRVLQRRSSCRPR